MVAEDGVAAGLGAAVDGDLFADGVVAPEDDAAGGVWVKREILR